MKNLYLLSIISTLIVSCAEHSEETYKQSSDKLCDLYIYANNRSVLDSTARAELIIDDSVLVKQKIPYSSSSSSNLIAKTSIHTGNHKVRVTFGRYSKDTVFSINQHTSILTSMHYEHKYPANNGLAVIAIIRDGSGGRD